MYQVIWDSDKASEKLGKGAEYVCPQSFTKLGGGKGWSLTTGQGVGGGGSATKIKTVLLLGICLAVGAWDDPSTFII